MEFDAAPKKKGLACPRCGNRLRVRPEQVGTQVMCPKCESTFTVGQSAAPPSAPKAVAPPTVGSSAPLPLAAAPSVHDDDAYEPEIPLTRPLAEAEPQMVDLSPSANRQVGYEVDWDQADDIEVEAPHERPTRDEGEYLALAEARGMVRSQVFEKPPEFTFFSGVFSFPWRGPNITRWVAISFGMTCTGELMVATVDFLRGGVGLGTLAGPILALFVSIMALLTGAFTAPCFLAAVQDTADGFDEVQESTLPDWDQWFFSLLSVLSVWLLSGTLGVPLTLIPEIGPSGVLIGNLLFVPILILSALECESFLLPYSPAVLSSLRRNAGAWLVFYLVSSVLVACWFGLSLLATLAPYLSVVVLAPTFAAVVLIYARLLGRLAWVITGSPLSRVEDRGGPGRSAAMRPAKKKGRRRGLKMPEDLDAGAEMLAERRPPVGPSNTDRRR